MRMSTKQMADVMYAVVMTHAKITSTFGVGIYEYDKSINSRHTCWVMVGLEESELSKFQQLSGLQLLEPENPVLS